MAEEKKEKNPPRPPQMSPYVFTFLLLGFGLWCFWDGWVAKDTGMADYAVTMNRVASLVLIPWAVWDFFNVKKKYKKKEIIILNPALWHTVKKHRDKK